MTSAIEPPLPPFELADRVCCLLWAEDPMEFYDVMGRATHEEILGLMPEGWSLEGKRMLDFGCGAGRTLRHFMAEGEKAEIWGCDIDRPSVDWINENLSPPLHAKTCEPDPPLDFPDGHFDVIWAMSVFTHLTDNWAEWLLEMHRVLADDGILIVTVMGERVSQALAREPWDSNRVGMNVLRHHNDWDLGGPDVLHSEWWIRAHWGRAFEIESFEFPKNGWALSPHHWAVMKKRPVQLQPAELTALEPDEPREVLALQHHVKQLQYEAKGLSVLIGWIALGYQQTLSWRLTRPVRWLGDRFSRNS